MGSRFLSVNDSSGSLSSLQDATFDLNVKSAKIEGLIPNMPVRTDETTKKLVSSKIALSDIDETFSQDIQDIQAKTLFIQLPVSNDGTHFSDSVVADKFVKVGGLPNEYLMVDGSTSTSSSSFSGARATKASSPRTSVAPTASTPVTRAG